MNFEQPLNISHEDWAKTPTLVKTYIQQATQQLEQLKETLEANPIISTLPNMAELALEGERRQVTVIFADISGFTALNDAAKSPAEVELVVYVVNRLLQELSEAIYEFDGYIDKYVGDEIMAVFGAPKAHENDPELALRAVLSMVERLHKFNENPPIPLAKPFGLHGGVNSGQVIAGVMGAERRRSYTVMGDAVNVAARLESESERGQFFVSESTYNLTKRFFTFETREPVRVKGKPNPIAVYELTGARDRPLQGPDSQAPFTGREEELATLKHMYEQMYARKGQVVILTSDAGMGKSRLVQEFRRRVDQENAQLKPVWLSGHEAGDIEHDHSKPLWLFGRGLSYRRSFANRLFVDILYSYLGLAGKVEDTVVKLRLEAMGNDLFPQRKNEIIPFLATMLGITLDPEVAETLPLNDPQALQQRTFLAMGEWVETLAQRHPVIMVFEDLHWADPSSVTLIEYLFGLAFYIPVMLICATRFDRETNFWKVKESNKIDYKDEIHEMILWPLTDYECRQVITRLLQIDQIPTDMEQLILSRAEGNPLFLEEVLRSLIEQEIIQYQDNQWKITRAVTEVDIPNTLQGVLTARLDRLENDVRAVLQVAAVIGRVFPRFILGPMVPEPDKLADALSKLQAAELIEIRTQDPEPEYMFKHVLTYELAYNSMLLQQRKVIHKRIGDYMARLFWQLGEEYASHVAVHYTKAEEWDRAFRYLVRAAEAAMQSFFNREAVEFYSRALEIVDKIPAAKLEKSAVMEVYYGRARILSRLGHPQEAIADYEVMRAKSKELKDDSAQLRALNGIGALHANYDFSSATELFQSALRVARRIGDKSGVVDTLNQLGNFYLNMGDLNQSVTYYKEARNLSLELEKESTRIEAEDGLASVNLERGKTAACIQRYDEEILHVRRRLGYRGGLIKSLATLLRAHTYSGNYYEARLIVEELDQLNKKSTDLFLMPLIRYHQGLGLLYQGQFDAAMQNFELGLDISYKQQQKGWQVLGLTMMSFYHLILGLDEKALEQATQANNLALELGSPLYILRAQSVLGAVYRRLNRLNEATMLLENIYNVAIKMDLMLDAVMILYQLGRTYVNHNQWHKVKDTAVQLLELAQSTQMREYVVLAHLLQAMVEVQEKRYQTALNLLADAATLAEHLEGVLGQYWITIYQAELYTITKNEVAYKEAMLTAQKLQQRLAETMANPTLRDIFLNDRHGQRLQHLLSQHAI